MRIGILTKTRHNEVAPAQFEIAPVFEELNLAIDHNMMVWKFSAIQPKTRPCLPVARKAFCRHKRLSKHNNWSISVGDRNLLNPEQIPTKTPCSSQLCAP
ncbi:MAG: hypothetical protein ACLUKN_10575 [Bacilli bacterium]